MGVIRTTGGVVAAFLLAFSPAIAQPDAGSMFTYQGQLKLDGAPVDEPCEYVFRLYDSEVGGLLIAQYGDEAAPVVVELNKGVFTAMLDFGTAAFDGGARWLEVSVRRAAVGGPFATLSPRQCLTAAPYALHALSGGDVSSLDEAYNKDGPGGGRTINVSAGPLSLEGPDGLYVQGNVGIGVTNPTARLEVDGAIRSGQGGFIFPDGTVQTTAASGSAGPRGGDWDTNGDDIYYDLGNVGIGTDEPDFPLHVVGDIFADGTVRSHAFAGESPFIAEAPAGTTRLWIGDGLMGRPPFAALGTTTPQRLPDTLLHLADDFSDPFITLEINPNDNAVLPGETGIFFTTGTAGGMILGDLYIDESDPGTPLYINSFSDNDVVIVPNNVGFVGVGTSIPTRKLEVVEDTTFVSRFTGSATDAAVVEFRSSSADSTWELGVSGSAGAFGGTLPTDTGYIYHQQSASLALTFNPTNGFVGFGDVPTPMARIHIGGTPGVDGIQFPDGTVQTTAATGDHGMLMGLLDDDHPQYAHLPGRAGGQILNGGTAAGDDLTLDSTANASKGFVLLNPTGGNVGIGLSMPTSRLHVSGTGFPLVTLDSSSTQGTWLALGNSSAGGRYWQLVSTGSANGEGPGKLLVGQGLMANTLTTAPMTIQPTGEVGIGISSPEIRLHVIGGTDVTGASGGFIQTGSSTGLNIGLDNNEMQARNNGVPANLTINAQGGNVIIGDQIPGGNLGIGVGNPFWAIDVQDTQAVTRLTTTTHPNGAVLELRSDAVGPTYIGAINFNVGPGSTPGQIGYFATNEMGFRVNSVERMRIAANGNVGIMTTTPGEKLDVVGNARVSGTVYTSMVSSQGSPLELKTDDMAHIHVDDMTGNVGIGSPPPIPPEEALHVNGCVKADCYKLNGEKGLEVSPLNAVVATSNLTLIPSPTGTMRVRPLSTGVQNVLIPVSVPTSILGTPQELVRIRVCYKVNSSTTFITATRARTSQDNGAFTSLIDDPDDRKSNMWLCYEIMAPAMPAIDGPLFLNLELSAGGTGATHDIELGRITVFVMDV